jgi:CheY-like chemotaxis protein
MRRAGTILVVDDDPNDRMMIESALRTAGAEAPIVVLASGAEAIEYLRGTGEFGDRSRFGYPTFMITDLKMVPVDGLDVLEFLRSRPRSAVVPTIMFSSSADPDDVEKSYALGASCYHVKSTTAEGFHSQLKLIFDYWMTCEVPLTNEAGVRITTDSRGRIGERYSTDPFPGSAPPFPLQD